ncbi:MAG TPA: glycosyl hydrolase, partial [Micromonosporaceae bacterium]
YGYNSVSGQLMVSADKKTWENRGQVTLRDFAVSPDDPDTLVASGERGVIRSTDRGSTWKNLDDTAVMLLDWPAGDRLWAIGINGEVMRSADGGDTWSNLGSVDGVATAFAVQDNALHVATQDGRIQRSTDDGKTWDALY